MNAAGAEDHVRLLDRVHLPFRIRSPPVLRVRLDQRRVLIQCLRKLLPRLEVQRPRIVGFGTYAAVGVLLLQRPQQRHRALRGRERNHAQSPADDGQRLVVFQFPDLLFGLVAIGLTWQRLAEPVVAHALRAPLVRRFRSVQRAGDHRPAEQRPRGVVFCLRGIEPLHLVQQETDLWPFAKPGRIRFGRLDKPRFPVRIERDAGGRFLVATIMPPTRLLVVGLLDRFGVLFRLQHAVPPPTAPAPGPIAMGVALRQRCDQIKVDADPLRLDQRLLLRPVRRIRWTDLLGRGDKQFARPLVMANRFPPVLAPGRDVHALRVLAAKVGRTPFGSIVRDSHVQPGQEPLADGLGQRALRLGDELLGPANRVVPQLEFQRAGHRPLDSQPNSRTAPIGLQVPSLVVGRAGLRPMLLLEQLLGCAESILGRRLGARILRHKGQSSDKRPGRQDLDGTGQDAEARADGTFRFRHAHHQGSSDRMRGNQQRTARRGLPDLRRLCHSRSFPAPPFFGQRHCMHRFPMCPASVYFSGSVAIFFMVGSPSIQPSEARNLSASKTVREK